MTLARQLERSARIPLPALVAIGCKVQTTLDQCESLASKPLKLEGGREVVIDLVIVHDLAMAQNHPKLTADWFVHEMSTTHTSVVAASKNGLSRNLRTNVLWAGRTLTNLCPYASRPPPPFYRTAPSTTLVGAGERRTAPPPPASNPDTTPRLPEAAELIGAGAGGGWRVQEGARATVAAQ